MKRNGMQSAQRSRYMREKKSLIEAHKLIPSEKPLDHTNPNTSTSSTKIIEPVSHIRKETSPSTIKKILQLRLMINERKNKQMVKKGSKPLKLDERQ